MNWSNGFWRLWLLVSSLWGVAVVAAFIGFDGLNAAKHYYYSATADALESDYWSLREAESFRQDRKLTVKFPRDMSISFISTASNGKKFVLLRTADGSGGSRNFWIADPEDAKAKKQLLLLYERATSLHRQELIRNGGIWVCVLLGPPVALLFLGMAVRWVLSGFRGDASVQ